MQQLIRENRRTGGWVCFLWSLVCSQTIPLSYSDLLAKSICGNCFSSGTTFSAALFCHMLCFIGTLLMRCYLSITYAQDKKNKTGSNRQVNNLFSVFIMPRQQRPAAFWAENWNFWTWRHSLAHTLCSDPAFLWICLRKRAVLVAKWAEALYKTLNSNRK